MLPLGLPVQGPSLEEVSGAAGDMYWSYPVPAGSQLKRMMMMSEVPGFAVVKLAAAAAAAAAVAAEAWAAAAAAVEACSAVACFAAAAADACLFLAVCSLMPGAGSSQRLVLLVQSSCQCCTGLAQLPRVLWHL